MLLDIVVHSAGIQDRIGAKALLIRMHKAFPRLSLIWADGGYTGKLIEWTKEMFGWAITIIKRSDNIRGFHVLPKRWIVERTFGWFNFYRRLSKDVEHSVKSSETMVKITMISVMTRRLTQAP